MTEIKTFDLRAVDTIDNRIVLLDKENKLFFIEASEFHNSNAPATDYVGKYMLIKARIKVKCDYGTKLHDVQECQFYTPETTQKKKKNPAI